MGHGVHVGRRDSALPPSHRSVYWAEDEGVVAETLRAWDAEAHTLPMPPLLLPSQQKDAGAEVAAAPLLLPLRLVLLPAMPEWGRRGVPGGPRMTAAAPPDASSAAATAAAHAAGRLGGGSGAPAGGLSAAEAAACLRALPCHDATGGFFVAVLHKAAVLWRRQY